MSQNLEKTALMALHGSLASQMKIRLEVILGYQVTEADSPDAMIIQLQKQEYRLIIMDVNLGSPSIPTFEPAMAVYKQRGKATFVGVTGLDQEFVDKVNQAGIPCYRKDPTNIQPLYDALDSA